MHEPARSSHRPVRLRVFGTFAAAATLAATLAPNVGAAGPATSEGTIAYLSADRSSVHLVAPDGSGDRVAWSVPAGTAYGIEDVAWSPDGSRLAIASGHEALCSIYQYDLYTLRPDGSDLTRVTNPPGCTGLTGMPTGKVAVKIDNLLTDETQFFVYVAGAPEAQMVTIESGFEATVVFPSVADLGTGVPQHVVASNGDLRWFSAGVSADVTPGGTVDAGTLTIDSDSITTLGALSATWSPDGGTLGFQLGQGGLWRIGADPGSGTGEQPLLDLPRGTSAQGNDLTWSPNGDDVLYERVDTNPFTITRATVGGTDPGTPVVTVSLSHGIAWLPDGSAFVVSGSDSLLSSADLYLVGVASGNATPITAEGNAFAYWPSVSPDGQHIAYTRIEGSPSAPSAVELRTMDIDGSGDQVIAHNAIQPDWGPATAP